MNSVWQQAAPLFLLRLFNLPFSLRVHRSGVCLEEYFFLKRKGQRVSGGIYTWEQKGLWKTFPSSVPFTIRQRCDHFSFKVIPLPSPPLNKNKNQKGKKNNKIRNTPITKKVPIVCVSFFPAEGSPHARESKGLERESKNGDFF